MRARLAGVTVLLVALWGLSAVVHDLGDRTGQLAVAPSNGGRVFPDQGPASTYELARERAALVALYEATDGDNWRGNDNWLSDEPVGEWEGVVTDHHGRVIVLELWGKRGGLVGTIPPELHDLTHLRALQLGGDLTGPVPPELGNLSRLRVLSLPGGGLTGQIPPELGQLRELRVLSLIGNQLSGPIPPELGRLTEIRDLYLGHNQLSGAIPPELGNLANARLLALEHNELTGPIPDAFRHLRELRGLYLSENQLTGLAPEWIGSLPYLEELALRGIGLAGEIADQLGEIRSLAFVDLCNNRLVGEVPASMSAVNERGGAWLGENTLDGPLPCPSGENFRLYTHIWLDYRCGDEIYRKCEPTQPADIPAGASPQVLQRERDALATFYRVTSGESWIERSGWLTDRPVASWHGVETGHDGRVVALDLDRNNLRGELPPELGYLTKLRFLSLDRNQLHGSMPHELGDLQNLEVLWLGGNAFSGLIPPELGSLWRLTSLNLHNNDLTGGIPAELGSLVELEVQRPDVVRPLSP